MPISGAAQYLAFTASESGTNLQGLAGDKADPWPETRDAGQGGVVMLNHLARSQVVIALGGVGVVDQDDRVAERKRLARGRVHTEFGVHAADDQVGNTAALQRGLKVCT